MPTPSQTNPLSAFFSASGATGNKTTNADLPQWLKDLGMKGDAYAGGMLKPELRYGFKYKGGKIHFADGTSFDAKKQKDGSYSYTDASGAAQSYSPTDEQNSYNKAYKKSTENQSFLDKAKNTIGFELDHGLQITKELVKHPLRILTGAVDPLGTKISNAITGKDYKPVVDQLGGALPDRYADYENRTGNATGFASPLQGLAHVIAGSYAGGGLSSLANGAAASLGGAAASPLGGAAGAGGGGLSSLLGSAASALGSSPELLSQLVSAGNTALTPGATGVPGTGVPGVGSNASPGGTGTMPQGGSPLTAASFPMSGFRDQNAFDYLMQSLGLPSPSANPAAAPGAAPVAGNGTPPPAGLDNFAGMDFSSLFQGLLPPGSGSFGLSGGTPDGVKTIQPLPSSSPKTPPMGYAAVADGTRGPLPDPSTLVSQLAGAFGNGGAAMRTMGTRMYSK